MFSGTNPIATLRTTLTRLMLGDGPVPSASSAVTPVPDRYKSTFATVTGALFPH
jgi:hypothetical protein